MVGARNLITAHTLAKQLRPTTVLHAKVEDVKAAFPLAAQVEIEYALECLCRHYYFVQDKTIERDGLMKKSEFETYKRKHDKQLREAKQAAQNVKPVQRPNAPQPHNAAQPVVADAPGEIQPEARIPAQPALVPQQNVEQPEADELWQDDVNEAGVKVGFVAPVGYKVADITTQNEITKEYLQQGRVACLQKGEYWKETNDGSSVKMDSWYIGKVHGQLTKNKGPQKDFFHIKYPGIPNAKQQFVNLLVEDYGCKKKWVLVLEDEN
jgi:hypothetical protein